MCKSASLTFFYLANTAFLALGAAIVGVSAWAYEHHSHFKDIVSNAALVPLTTAGAALILVSLIALCAAHRRQSKLARCLLYFYGIVLFLIVVCEVAAAIALLVETGHIRNARDAQDDLHVNVTTSINRFVQDAYDDCCQGNPRVPVDCWIPKGTHIVTAATCAAEPVFRKKILDWLNSNLTPVGIVAICTAALQLIAVFTSCCAARRGKKERREREEEEQRLAAHGVYQNMEEGRGGGATARGQQISY